MEQRRLKLLALDGGGIRGLASLLILKTLMKRINEANPPKPCEVFDMMCGTSTGGLIAIMLGRLRMSIDDCIKAYLKMTDKIFDTQKLPAKLTWKGKIKTQARFDTSALESSIKEIIRQAGISDPENEKFLEKDPACRVIVCAAQGENRQIMQFANFPSTRWDTEWCTIFGAARATSAASSFFEPITMGPFGQTYLDGATGANNPVNQLWTTAQDVWARDGALENSIQCLLSIGTGRPGLEPFGNTLFEVAQTLLAIATATEEVHQTFANHYRKLAQGGLYVRLNVDRGLEHVLLEQTSKIPTIAAATAEYLARLDTLNSMENCIARLAAGSPADRLGARLEDLRVPSLDVGHHLAYRPIVGMNKQRVHVDGDFENAVQTQNIDVVRRFLLKEKSRRPSTDSQNRALFLAAKLKKAAIIRELLQMEDGPDLDVNAKIAGEKLGSPLHAAAAAGSLDATETLLESGADPNLVSGKYDTPLYAAIRYGHHAIVSLLLRYNADVNLPGYGYRHVLEYAIHLKRWRLVEELLQRRDSIDWNLIGIVYKEALDLHRRDEKAHSFSTGGSPRGRELLVDRGK